MEATGVYNILIQYSIYYYYCCYRPDITAMVDWAYNANLLTVFVVDCFYIALFRLCSLAESLRSYNYVILNE